MNDKPSFVAELKRRNVYKVAVAYAVVSWLLIQVATQVFPFFEIPNWAVRLVVLLLILGFPVALILSWAFEITPEGIKRESEVAPNRSIRRQTGKKILGLTVAVALIAAGMLAFQLLHRHSATAGTGSSESKVGRLGEASLPVPEKSIAVLPFENMSSDKENGYFAAGIQDEILTRLAKVGSLKVISRSSTQQYASNPGNLREVAQQLGVAHILEGSVQKAGAAVHINVQLITAATDDHLWAESYDRTLENIFGVEGEIAQTVAEALKAKLTGAEQQRLVEKPTNIPAAYEAYLRGTSVFWQATAESSKLALDSFREAVRLDPKFAAGWAALSRTNSLMFFHSDATPGRRAAAESALAEARRLQPNLPETQLAAAYFQYWVVRDYKGALEMLQRLRTSWPNNAEMLEVIAFISARLGQWQQSIATIDQSAALNPRDNYTRQQAIGFRLATRDTDAVLQMCDSALRDWPNDSNFLGLKTWAFQMRGELDNAQTIVNELAPNLSVTPLDIGAAAIWYQARLRRDPEIARKLFQSLTSGGDRNSPSSLGLLAELQEMFGQKAEAQKTFTNLRGKLESDLKGQPDNGDLIGPLVYVLARLGERDAALRALEKQSAVSANDERAKGVTEELRARILIYFGDKTGAIASLERILAGPGDGFSGPPLTPALLRLDPDFDPLRGDARFEKLAAGSK
jgi:TolB-like protein